MINIDSHVVVRNNRKILCTLYSVSPSDNILQNYSGILEQEIDLDTLHTYSDLPNTRHMTHLYVCICVHLVLGNFILSKIMYPLPQSR